MKVKESEVSAIFASRNIPISNEADVETLHVPKPTARIEVALLTGCQDRPYAFGLAMALVAKGVHVDEIGSDNEDSPELHLTPNLRF